MFCCKITFCPHVTSGGPKPRNLATYWAASPTLPRPAKIPPELRLTEARSQCFNHLCFIDGVVPQTRPLLMQMKREQQSRHLVLQVATTADGAQRGRLPVPRTGSPQGAFLGHRLGGTEGQNCLFCVWQVLGFHGQGDTLQKQLDLSWLQISWSILPGERTLAS